MNEVVAPTAGSTAGSTTGLTGPVRAAPRRWADRSITSRLITGAVVFAIAVSTAAAGASAQDVDPIVLDGRIDDWTQRRTILVDPADAPDAAVDIGRVAVDDDPHWLHFLIDLRRPVTLQGLDGGLLLLLDLDDDPRTGSTEHGMPGVDLVVMFTPPSQNRPDRPGRGVGVEWLRDGERRALSPYDFELAFAPTIASDIFEIRMARVSEGTDRPSLDGPRFNGRWVFLDRDRQVRDDTEIFTYEYTTAAAPYVAPQSNTDPLMKARGTSARVVSWNLEFGALFPNPGPFARVLQALQPDVLLFQELNASDGPEKLHQWLTTHLPGRPWSVVVGAGGGNLRTAVASTLPMRDVSALEVVTYEREGRTRDVRTASAMIDVGGVPTLFMSIHLKCCGRAGGPEDFQRFAEITAINEALASVVGFGEPVVVGGDYNLVGARAPMRPLVDERGLRKANIFHLDGRGVQTWYDVDSAFTPGRLDYMLFCNASLHKLNGFVFDTRHLSPRWLQRHSLERDDVLSASDHFPLVTDLAIRPSHLRERRAEGRGGRDAAPDRRRRPAGTAPGEPTRRDR